MYYFYFLHQFEGTGSLSTSMGTSHSEAMANQALRQEITRHPEVVAFFDTFRMEDKTGLVVLDQLKASDQVRVVLNNQKRVCVFSDHHCILSHFRFSVSYIPRRMKLLYHMKTILK